MQYEPNDNEVRESRLTAFALGELDGEERTEVEAHLADNPIARKEVESIREMADLLTTELRDEPAESLSVAQRQVIESELAREIDPPFIWTRRSWWVGAGTTALAACLGLVVLLPVLLEHGGEEKAGDEFAINAPSGVTARIDEGNAPTDAFTESRKMEERRQKQVASEEAEGLHALRLLEKDSPARGRMSGALGADDDQLRADRKGDEGVDVVFDAASPAAGPPVAAKTRSQTPASRERGYSGGGGALVGGARAGGGGVGGLRSRDTSRAHPKETLERDERAKAADKKDPVSIAENAFKSPGEQPRSTFPIEVDTASYAIVQRALADGRMPEPEVVRIEGMLNSFTYDYAPPAADSDHPFRTNVEVAACPWNPDHRLVRIGLRTETTAEDVSVQLEFNPQRVDAYRLIGYDNGLSALEDAPAQTKEAGEITAGFTTTVMYEIVAAGTRLAKNEPDEDAAAPAHLRERTNAPAEEAPDRLFVLRVRYKQSNGAKKTEFGEAITDSGQSFASASQDFRFAAAVATFGLVLRDSPYKGSATFDLAHDLALAAAGDGENGARTEFLKLIERAQSISADDE